MRGSYLIVNLLLFCGDFCQILAQEDNDEFGTNLVASMRNDANLDLSLDEEYEDLRAELLAYHTALASLSSVNNRRSMLQTPCWAMGGICVDHLLCTGFRSLTEVPGCKGRLMVCCFAWNQYKVKDWRHKGIGLASYPWSEKQEFGGKGVIDTSKIKKLKKKLNMQDEKEGEEELNEDEEEHVEEVKSGEKKSLEIVQLAEYEENPNEKEEDKVEPEPETKAIALLLRSNKK